jgi:hypothetical protein
MREIRLSGSEGGGTQSNAASLPLSCVSFWTFSIFLTTRASAVIS